jgi:hypothetical protein
VTVVLAIDPGPVRSAFLVFNGETQRIRQAAIVMNGELVDMLAAGVSAEVGAVVIEWIESYGMAVGREVFETVHWSGRFTEAARPAPVVQLPRRAVKLHLCGSSRAKDPNVRTALLDRFGGAGAKGTKAAPGPLYGIAADLWSALAIAVTWTDQAAGR